MYLLYNLTQSMNIVVYINYWFKSSVQVGFVYIVIQAHRFGYGDCYVAVVLLSS